MGVREWQYAEEKTKASAGFSHRGLLLWFFCTLLGAFYLGTCPVVRNSANSVELLIFVTTQGSGPRVADGCSATPLPIGVGPKAIARLVCSGQSNKEIAETAHLNVAMVKKHVHAIFRKLEVPCRSRLVALML